MRELTSHKVNGLNNALTISVLDGPGPGGASHDYVIRVPIGNGVTRNDAIQFQNGPIQSPEDINGITNEALIAIVEDRLKGFQSGQFACRENALALTHLQEAMHWLHARTRERMQRGVEGTLGK